MTSSVPGANSSNPLAGVTPSSVPSAALAAHSVQALIELVYVQTANNLVASALISLDQALSTTQGALNTLAQLQSLHNDISTPARGSFPFNYLAGGTATALSGTKTVTVTDKVITVPQLTVNTSYTAANGATATRATVNASYTTSINNTGDYIAVYDLIASSFYGRPIDPVFTLNTAGTTTTPSQSFTIPSAGFLQNNATTAELSAYQNYVKVLYSARQQVLQEISQLSGITPPTASGGVDQTSLYYQLQKVLKDMPNLTSTSLANYTSPSVFSAVNAWVLDNYNQQGVSGVASQGLIQQNLTNAITAGQSLNDTQKQAVRRYMFVFEEYYQSAASLLNSITQIISKMAQNV